MLPWNERLHGVGAQIIMELVHMHEGLVRFPAVARIVESRPSDVELQGGSSIAVAAVCAVMCCSMCCDVMSQCPSFFEVGSIQALKDAHEIHMYEWG